jgi:hypothetical protein
VMLCIRSLPVPSPISAMTRLHRVVPHTPDNSRAAIPRVSGVKGAKAVRISGQRLGQRLLARLVRTGRRRHLMVQMSMGRTVPQGQSSQLGVTHARTRGLTLTHGQRHQEAEVPMLLGVDMLNDVARLTEAAAAAGSQHPVPAEADGVIHIVILVGDEAADSRLVVCPRDVYFSM